MNELDLIGAVVAGDGLFLIMLFLLNMLVNMILDLLQIRK